VAAAMQNGVHLCVILLMFPLRMTKLPFALSLSKGLSEWAQGFDKALLSEVEGLSPNGSRMLS